MKKMTLAALVAVVSAPASSYAAAVPAASGTLLSTNLSAAVLRLNNATGVNTVGLFGAGAVSSSGGVTPGIFIPILGPQDPSQGCSASPENGTALLAVLGGIGLVVGRLAYSRTQRSRVPVAA